jgi:hypothetical protein
LRAKRSNPELQRKKNWVASSLTLLAMTENQLAGELFQNDKIVATATATAIIRKM